MEESRAAKRRRPGGLLVACWAVAVGNGAAQAWNSRFSMNPDGISYLEVGEALWRLDLANGVNGYWSPLYPLLLGLADRIAAPSPAWEFQLVHLVNFVIYLFALAAFNLLLWRLMERSRDRAASAAGGEGVPVWAWWTIGHGLFIWATRLLTDVVHVTPDLLGLAILMAVAALFLWIEERRVGGVWLVAFGLLVGLSYLGILASSMPALVFLGMLTVMGRGTNGARRILGLGLLGCALVAGPFALALSLQKNRPTLGDKGRLAYAWVVNDVEWFAHWQGDPPASGVAAHPTRKLSDRPAVFEFGSPVAGTYPPWFDPSYWYEGLTPRLDWRRQWDTIRGRTLPQLARMLGRTANLLVLGGLGAVVLLVNLVLNRAGPGRRALWPEIALVAPALAGVLIYLPVHLLERYVGGSLLLLGLAALACVRLPASGRRRRAARLVLMLFVGVLLAVLGPRLARDAGRAVGDVSRHGLRDLSAHSHLRVAEQLLAAGLAEGDQIAHIGDSFSAYWARLGRFRIVAEIPYLRWDRWKLDYARDFQLLDEQARSEVLETLALAGASAIVATNMPLHTLPTPVSPALPEAWKAGWQRLVEEETGLFAASLLYEDGSVYLYRPEQPGA